MTTGKKTEYFDRYIEKCRKYGPRGLYNCYKKPSSRKLWLWDKLMNDEFSNYIGVSIITYNGFVFTVGGVYKDSDGRIWFRVETPSDTGYLKLVDEQIKRVKEVLKIWA